MSAHLFSNLCQSIQTIVFFKIGMTGMYGGHFHTDFFLTTRFLLELSFITSAESDLVGSCLIVLLIFRNLKGLKDTLWRHNFGHNANNYIVLIIIYKKINIFKTAMRNFRA